MGAILDHFLDPEMETKMISNVDKIVPKVDSNLLFLFWILGSLFGTKMWNEN